jgi:hypothetical protein
LYQSGIVMNPWKALIAAALVVVSPAAVSAQQTGDQPTAAASDASPVVPERWNLYFQATAIGDEHGTFYAPYTGPLSLQDYPEHDVSLTSTLFFAALLATNTQLVFNPEIAGGKGFSGVSGIANPPNGELPRALPGPPFRGPRFWFRERARARGKRRQSARGRAPGDALLHLRGPLLAH